MQGADRRLPFLGSLLPDRPALLDDNRERWLSYGELAALADEWARRLSGEKALIFLYIDNSVDGVAALLGALSADHAVALFDPALSDELRKDLEDRYTPDWVIGPRSGNIQHRPKTRITPKPHRDTALLLSTSGSTGSPKLVRLTLCGMEANAAGIAQVLAIAGDDVGAGHLPLHYSYGLSVLTSHLISGARIRLTAMGMMDRGFWPAMREAGITHMPGVPFHYQMMLKLGLRRLNLPTLRTMTQAGGGLDVDARRQVHDHMETIGGRFHVLYGQTEAGPRMTTLQHAEFDLAPASVGTALPGCTIKIADPSPSGEGEVIFHGPNVMMGYALCREDLAREDEMLGRLATGDIGRLDSAGRLTLTGRAKRSGKIYGLRVNLDELELQASAMTDAAITQHGESVLIHIASTGNETQDAEIEASLLERLRSVSTLPAMAFQCRRVSHIPRTERGKVDYAALEAQL